MGPNDTEYDEEKIIDEILADERENPPDPWNSHALSYGDEHSEPWATE